jgi:sulfatase maturation enzyme AslB (radical SAM superfamily)
MNLPDDFNQPSKHSFCVLGWIHRFVNLGGEVQLCCVAEEYPDSYIKSDSGERINLADGYTDQQIDDSRHTRGIRTDMLEGTWPAACERCKITEQCGGSSRRNAENQHFKHHIPWILANTDEQGFAPVHIRSRDYRLGNLCNLRCRMCHPRASKLMLDDWNQVSRRRGRIKGENARQIEHMDWFESDQMWADFAEHIDDLEHLHFAGGEPLVIPEVLRALEICVELGAAGRIELTFNTNVTKIPKKHRQLWPHFKSVNLLCSIDGFGEMNDYIRYPAKWATIARNLDIIDKEHEALNLGWATISVTVQIYNIFKLADLIEYSHQRFSFIRPMPNLVHLTTPEHFNIQYLPDDLRRDAEEYLQSLRQRLESAGVINGLEQLESIQAFMQSGKYSAYQMSEFRRVTAVFDRLRDESLQELVPELSKLMQPGSEDSLDERLELLKSKAGWLAGKIKNRLSG